MMNKSYDYVWGNRKFIFWFDVISGVICCTGLSYCLTEFFFSFDFKVTFQKILIFTILLALLLRLFYLFIKRRRYELLEDKIVYGFRRKEILYRSINSVLFTLALTPSGQYNIGLSEPYIWIKENGTKRYISHITIYLAEMNPVHKFEFNCYNAKSIANLINYSEADIFVKKSFLSRNNWTIDKFCKEYSISADKVHLVEEK